MFITRKADYAVRCVLFLSMEPDRTVSTAGVSGQMLVPRTFLAKILQQLTKKGIVQSVQGVTGGFRLARSPEEINLLEVIEAIQGISAANACAVDERACSLSGKCAVHPVWVELRKVVEERLSNETFAMMVERARKDKKGIAGLAEKIAKGG